MRNTRYWFPAKRYGWGWGPPTTWQGWVILVVWLMITIGAMLWLNSRHPLLVGPAALVMVAVLLAICYAKGEPPRWRWGEPRDRGGTRPRS